MTIREISIPDLAQATAGWAGEVPTQGDVPPVPTAGVDPITAAVVTTTGLWPATHEAFAARRGTDAGKLTGANGATSAILGSTDSDNAAIIAASGLEA